MHFKFEEWVVFMVKLVCFRSVIAPIAVPPANFSEELIIFICPPAFLYDDTLLQVYHSSQEPYVVERL